MFWLKTKVSINGVSYDAIAPVIVSASRATDIPAFYAKDFIRALQQGYLYWSNPFNGKKSLVSFEKTKLVVFWSKNPAPLIPYLNILGDLGINCYFNFTLNDYEPEGYEKQLPKIEKRISTFIKLSEKIGKENMVWRFDPVIVTKNMEIATIIDRIENIAKQIAGHTNKLVFSFVDTSYKKVENRFRKNNIDAIDFTRERKLEFAQKLSVRLAKYELEIASCAEGEDLSVYGIAHNSCIDAQLMANNFKSNKKLMEFIGHLKNTNQLKDKGQRKFCKCLPSKDIGRYNTCGFACVYCYAMQKDKPRLIGGIFT